MSVTFYQIIGQAIIREARSLNVAEGNAPAVLSLMGLDGADLTSGTIPASSIPDIARRLVKIKNRPAAIAERTCEDYEDPAPGPGPRVIEYGRSFDQVSRYVDVLLAMCLEASKSGASIVWA
jgi:hypothetical protein